MFWKEGPVFLNAETAEVIAHLRERKLVITRMPPDRLHITHDGRTLYLQYLNGYVHQYPLRHSFVQKLLSWFSFPIALLEGLDIETVASILNDYLLRIKAEEVRVVVENDEALTLTGTRFSDLSDLDVINLCRPLGINAITRTDFFLRLYSDEEMKVEPVPGDVCGFGYDIINSETGFRALRVAHYIKRYVCSNGATVKTGKSARRVHTGLSRDAIRVFLSKNLLDGAKERQRIAAQLTAATTADAAPFIEQAEKALRSAIGIKQARALLRTLPEKPTRYELINLITREAQNHNPATRLRLEALGGELITVTERSATSRTAA